MLDTVVRGLPLARRRIRDFFFDASSWKMLVSAESGSNAGSWMAVRGLSFARRRIN